MPADGIKEAMDAALRDLVRAAEEHGTGGSTLIMIRINTDSGSIVPKRYSASETVQHKRGDGRMDAIIDEDLPPIEKE